MRPGAVGAGRNELRALQEQIERIFAELSAPRAASPVWRPALDLASTPEAYEISVDLPGVGAERVTLAVREGVLWLSGEKTPAEEPGRVLRGERRWGRCGAALPLPRDVDPGAISARLERGVLTIRLGRRAAWTDRVIAIEEVAD